MALDPQCRAMLDVVAENGSPFDHEDPAKAREMMAATTRPIPDPDERFADVHDARLTGPAGDIAYRYFRPNDTPEIMAPCIIYYHGGGMVFGTIDSHDPICRAIALAADCVVISIDYRLAPEDKFPSAVDDAWAAYMEIRTHADNFGVDRNRIAVGGDSAGGNLAAVIPLLAKEKGVNQPCMQWLVFPVTDWADTNHAPAGGTIERFAEGYLLTQKGIAWIQREYLNSDADRTDWRASPLQYQDLSGLAPALIQTAGFDPLKDEADAYAARLIEAGVEAKLIDYPGMIHGFMRAIGVVDVAQLAIDEAAVVFRKAFGSS